MSTAAALILSYLILSFVAGLLAMVVDMGTDFKFPVLKRLIPWLYVPPLVVLMLAGALGALAMIWTAPA